MFGWRYFIYIFGWQYFICIFRWQYFIYIFRWRYFIYIFAGGRYFIYIFGWQYLIYIFGWWYFNYIFGWWYFIYIFGWWYFKWNRKLNLEKSDPNPLMVIRFTTYHRILILLLPTIVWKQKCWQYSPLALIDKIFRACPPLHPKVPTSTVTSKIQIYAGKFSATRNKRIWFSLLHFFLFLWCNCEMNSKHFMHCLQDNYFWFDIILPHTQLKSIL